MSQTVAVTGGTGYVACELIKQLLEIGYTVRATVRDVNAIEKVQPLLNLANALPGTLELVEADLLQPGSFDSAFQGCIYVFHTASPFFIQSDNPQADLVDVAVKGTCNVMNSAGKATGLLRVVLTSSCAAVKGANNAAPPKNGKFYNEEDWNETSTVENGEPYFASKVQAEQAAWQIAKEMNIDLVTINPQFIMGPLLSSRTDGTSVGYMRAWVEGTAQSGSPVLVDVRDVARAHILAAENPNASGRYIVANSTSTPAQDISAWLQARFPDYEFAKVEKEEERVTAWDPSKVQKELGLVLTPVRRTVLEMAATMVALGVATLKKRV